MFNLSPKEDKFFDMFIAFSEIIHKSTVMLRDFVKDPSNAEAKQQAIKDVEHDGDVKLHEIFSELHKSFITPIDREDIHMIGKAMDEIIDFAEQTSSRFVMFNVSSSKEHVIDMAEYSVQCTNQLKVLLKELKHMKKSKALEDPIVEINRIENEGDVAYRNAVRELFTSDLSTLDIMIWKEIYENIENVLDACEDVANIIEGVVMKHA